jgi:HAD superfamily hydrolase (TIGR01509 family)
MMNKILFCDWNGTLLNDMPVWDKARRKTFLAFDVEPPTIADHFRELESGDYLEVYRNRGITASRDELNAVYEPAYEEQLADATLFPDVAETLQKLHQNNVRLVLVTAQQNTLVIPLLKKFDIDSLFEECAFHVFDKKKVITEIARKNGINLKQCSLVGDSPSDIRHAKKAGITAVAFLGGYIPEGLLTDADYFIHTFKDILNVS